MLPQKHRLSRLILLCLGLVCANSQAQEQEQPICGFYYQPDGALGQQPCFAVSAGLGLASFSPDDDASSWFLVDDTAAALRLSLSYSLLTYGLLEVSYNRLGKAAFKNTNTAITSTETIRYDTPAVFAGVQYPLAIWRDNSQLTVNAKIGLAAVQTASSSALLPIDQSASSSLAWGVGANYQFNHRWAIRTDFESFSEDTALLSMSAMYLWGAKNRAIYRPQTVDTVVPHQSDAPAKPAEQETVADNISPCAEASNAARCKPYDGSFVPLRFKHRQTQIPANDKRGQQVLRHYVGILRAYPATHVAVVGHADGYGRTAANMHVATLRAQAVMDYLIAQGIDERRLKVVIKGADEPSRSSDVRRRNAQGYSIHDRRVELIAIDID